MRKDQIHLVAQLDNLCIDQWLFMMIIGTEGALGLPTAYDNQGWTGKLFFSQGGAGRGGARPKFFGAGNPPFPTVRGRAGKGSKSAGRGGARAGNILRVSAD